MNPQDFHPESMDLDELTKDLASDLIDLVADIRQPLRDNCPPSHPVRHIVDYAFCDDLTGSAEETKTFHEAWKEWCALPLAERQRILNGWKPDDEPPTGAGLMQHMSEMTWGVVSGIELDVLSPGSIGSDFRWWFSESTEAVRVLIRRGSTKAEVMRCLRDVAIHVDERWTELITDPLEVAFPNRK